MSETFDKNTSKKISPIPEGFNTITPHLVVKNAADAIEFYKKAFGAQELSRQTLPDGKSIMHAVLRVANSMIMLADEYPRYGSEGPVKCGSPMSIGGNSVFLFLYVEDADTVFNKAVAAGAKSIMPLMDAFWGDRYGQLLDPFGHLWEISTHKRDLSYEEIEKAGRAFFAEMSSKNEKEE